MKKSGNWRPNIIFGFIILFGAAIAIRLFFLQILEHKLFLAQALGQQVGFSSVVGTRGQIFAAGPKEAKSLAINKDNWTISVNPQTIQEKSLFAETISQPMGISKEEILSKLSEDTFSVVLKKGLSSSEADEVEKLNLKGLVWQNNPQRYYPQGEFLSQTLGFLGGEGSGQYGIEGYYDEILSGKSGIKEQGRGISSIFGGEEISLNGSDIHLTVDYNIQFQAESLLRKAKEKFDIDSGQILVLKPDSGKILALAEFPSFNLNEYSQEKDLGIFQNAAVQKLFEPGSIMKPFAMAAALNEKKITPETTYVDEGVLTFGSKSIRNFAKEVYGQQTMTQVLEKSINTGAVFAQQQVSHRDFFSYMEKFGFTQKTGIDLQGEVYSGNSSLKNGSDINFATASFGQGIELTPMQIARAYCAIANGGRLPKPHIVEKIINGNDQSSVQSVMSAPVISEGTASQLTSMLVSVVDNGFNSVAKIPGYLIAGKTGTAQVPLLNKKGYDPDKTIQSFVGYGPALNSQFVILVKLDNPKVAKSSLSAVPIFKELAQYIINYLKIPPDYGTE